MSETTPEMTPADARRVLTEWRDGWVKQMAEHEHSTDEADNLLAALAYALNQVWVDREVAQEALPLVRERVYSMDIRGRYLVRTQRRQPDGPAWRCEVSRNRYRCNIRVGSLSCPGLRPYDHAYASNHRPGERTTAASTTLRGNRGVTTGRGCKMMKGIELIAAERQRQVEVEGWTPEHDAGHADGEMGRAAACYAAGTPIYREIQSFNMGDQRLRHTHIMNVWPWAGDWYGPTNRIRDLTKAGALIAAEIDRLLAESQGERQENAK